MNFTQQLVAMMVAVLMADGKQEPEELEVIRAMARDLELDINEVEELIALEIANPQPINNVAKQIKKEDRETILAGCVSVALSDKYLCQSEIELLLEIAKLLKVSVAKTILNIAAFVQNDRSILIEGNDALHNEITIEEDDEE
jgi:uncharacterized tellurite resistance protein B-like protein